MKFFKIFHESYLVTKERYFHVPTYESLKSSLAHMKEHMLRFNITNLAMPQIGIGLDKLEWEKVKEILCELFSETNIKITVYRYKCNSLVSFFF